MYTSSDVSFIILEKGGPGRQWPVGPYGKRRRAGHVHWKIKLLHYWPVKIVYSAY